jgi:hypothetical protein
MRPGRTSSFNHGRRDLSRVVRRPAYHFLAVCAVVVLLGACASLDPILKPGFRHIVMTVENTSNRPAILVVAKDEQPMGAVVGTTTPGTVPPGMTVDVTFGLPPEPGWAIFVNPGPEHGPLFGEQDVPPQASGRAPFTITVAGDGTNIGASSTQRDTPGWMGNP